MGWAIGQTCPPFSTRQYVVCECSLLVVCSYMIHYMKLDMLLMFLYIYICMLLLMFLYMLLMFLYIYIYIVDVYIYIYMLLLMFLYIYIYCLFVCLFLRMATCLPQCCCGCKEDLEAPLSSGCLMNKVLWSLTARVSLILGISLGILFITCSISTTQ